MSKETAGRTPSAPSSPDLPVGLPVSPSLSALPSISAGSAVLDSASQPATVPTVVKPHFGQSRLGTGKARPTSPRKLRSANTIAPAHRFAAIATDDHGHNRQAELFYLQKQIQLQTQMVIVLEDGARVQGVIEWYDRNSIKVRGKSRVLIYKAAIKYLFKASETGDE
jgi:sRNA-binding regulator protein Hfq